VKYLLLGELCQLLARPVQLVHCLALLLARCVYVCVSVHMQLNINVLRKYECVCVWVCVGVCGCLGGVCVNELHQYARFMIKCRANRYAGLTYYMPQNCCFCC